MNPIIHAKKKSINTGDKYGINMYSSNHKTMLLPRKNNASMPPNHVGMYKKYLEY